MKKTNILIVMAALFFGAMAFAQNDNAMPLDKIVAVVNDSVITQSQLNRQVAFFKQQAQQQTTEALPPDAVIQKQILQQLINRELELQTAKRANIKATPAEVDKAIQLMAKQQNKTPDQIYQVFAKQGWSKDDFKNEMQEEVTIQKLQGQAIAPMVQVTPEDVDQAYQQQLQGNQSYHVSDILVSTEKEANTLYSQLQKNTKIKAGQASDMGWRSTSDLPELFVATVTDMNVGEISKPIKAPNGYHILKLIDKKEANLTKQQVREMLFQKKFAEEMEKFIKQQREQSYIKIMP